MANAELVEIIKKFAESGWEVIDAPSKIWLDSNGAPDDTRKLLDAIKQAHQECGTCGCEFDPLYKKAMELLQIA